MKERGEFDEWSVIVIGVGKFKNCLVVYYVILLNMGSGFLEEVSLMVFLKIVYSCCFFMLEE